MQTVTKKLIVESPPLKPTTGKAPEIASASVPDTLAALHVNPETGSTINTEVSYLDAYRSAWLPANLIQAQRDYFGAHTYERIDAKGTFHTEWEKE